MIVIIIHVKKIFKKYPVKLAFDIDITGIELSDDDKQLIIVDIFYKSTLSYLNNECSSLPVCDK